MYYPEECQNQNDPYRYTNTWGETYRSECELPKGKGKGQGAKGDSMLRTDPSGEFFEKSMWATKVNERSVVGATPLLSEFARFAKMGSTCK